MIKEFLQSNEWLKFQESVGRKTFHLESENFWANIVEHNLPITGKYFYIPRGPVVKSGLDFNFKELVELAKKNNAGWIRIEPETEELLDIIRKNTKYKIIKSLQDVQPREIFVINIAKKEEDILAEMKPKTRYNIRLAEKKSVKIASIKNEKTIAEFLRLTQVMAKRQKIKTHKENYYRKMLEIIPDGILKLYVAEYAGKIIATNLVVFYGDVCIYLHGASDDDYRGVMAPYLLQWQQICDAKKANCVKYDFGGISKVKWQGITRFKEGFSSKTQATIFPGSYDMIVNNKSYVIYRISQKLKNIF
jgi:lipid II:glycine glycyltransferase (peptidoglycan interpeptide bridge formation enzyme)